MRTTIDLDASLYEKARQATGIQRKTDLLEEGLRALVRRHAASQLAALGGSDASAKAGRRRRVKP